MISCEIIALFKRMKTFLYLFREYSRILLSPLPVFLFLWLPSSWPAFPYVAGCTRLSRVLPSSALPWSSRGASSQLVSCLPRRVSSVLPAPRASPSTLLTAASWKRTAVASPPLSSFAPRLLLSDPLSSYPLSPRARPTSFIFCFRNLLVRGLQVSFLSVISSCAVYK